MCFLRAIDDCNPELAVGLIFIIDYNAPPYFKTACCTLCLSSMRRAFARLSVISKNCLGPGGNDIQFATWQSRSSGKTSTRVRYLAMKAAASRTRYCIRLDFGLKTLTYWTTKRMITDNTLLKLSNLAATASQQKKSRMPSSMQSLFLFFFLILRIAFKGASMACILVYLSWFYE